VVELLLLSLMFNVRCFMFKVSCNIMIAEGRDSWLPTVAHSRPDIESFTFNVRCFMFKVSCNKMIAEGGIPGYRR
jgi:hypothetical protein